MIAWWWFEGVGTASTTTFTGQVSAVVWTGQNKTIPRVNYPWTPVGKAFLICICFERNSWGAAELLLNAKRKSKVCSCLCLLSKTCRFGPLSDKLRQEDKLQGKTLLTEQRSQKILSHKYWQRQQVGGCVRPFVAVSWGCMFQPWKNVRESCDSSLSAVAGIQQLHADKWHFSRRTSKWTLQRSEFLLRWFCVWHWESNSGDNKRFHCSQVLGVPVMMSNECGGEDTRNHRWPINPT